MDQVIEDAAHYLQVYDNDLIFSWTPNEFRLKIKGAQHRVIDEYEMLARSAMFNRYANNSKRAKEKKMFDAEKARRRLDRGDKHWKQSHDSGFAKAYRKASKALKGYFARQKGG
ncbi:hypothetical protein [Terribacillus saccharophilus]|uniref:hypothetical protein n=1 Tax=Terribacillus saccharophilus TaxID=361277 RepID=UPI0015954DE0|nr:hypothetical protein [Terribacillus saccharophilus]